MLTFVCHNIHTSLIPAYLILFTSLKQLLPLTVILKIHKNDPAHQEALPRDDRPHLFHLFPARRLQPSSLRLYLLPLGVQASKPSKNQDLLLVCGHLACRLHLAGVLGRHLVLHRVPQQWIIRHFLLCPHAFSHSLHPKAGHHHYTLPLRSGLQNHHKKHNSEHQVHLLLQPRQGRGRRMIKYPLLSSHILRSSLKIFGILFKRRGMEFINNFKNLILQDTGQLQSLRLSITQEQLDCFWQGKTLAEMSEILTISNEYIVNFVVSHLLPPYLNSKKVVYQAFIVNKLNEKGEQVPVIYSYDCKLFRNHLYSLQENQFISSFLLCYREDVPVEEPVFELVDADQLPPCRWILKIKQSQILKIYSSIQDYFKRLPFSSDKIILPAQKYYFFIQQWLKCYYNYNLEITLNNFFKGLLALLENQILLEYFKTLTPEEKEERMYRRPVKVIDKPKNVEQFTLTQQHFGEIRWQTLKIITYKLKYRVEEQEDRYRCYRIKEKAQHGSQFHQLPLEDQTILLAFNNLRSNQRQYREQYTQQ